MATDTADKTSGRLLVDPHGVGESGKAMALRLVTRPRWLAETFAALLDEGMDADEVLHLTIVLASRYNRFSEQRLPERRDIDRLVRKALRACAMEQAFDGRNLAAVAARFGVSARTVRRTVATVRESRRKLAERRQTQRRLTP